MTAHGGSSVGTKLAERGAAAAAIAGRHADDVDAERRFPREAIAAMKQGRLLGAMLPVDLGGEGATLSEIAEICSLLGQQCASAGMVYAMHQIQVSSLVLHAQTSEWHRTFLRRVADDQLLLASATSEAGVGGDLRTSLCAVERDGDTYRLEKNASVISYGADADAILATARREPDSPASDQVLVVVMKDHCTLERTSQWDTMGMRGTCSEGFRLKAEGPASHILPKPFAEIAARSMLATSHLLWAALWYGIALAAVHKAQAFVRAEARKRPDEKPAGAIRVAEAASQLQMMKSMARDGLHRFEQAQADADELTSVGFSVAMNNVKVATSQIAIDIVNKAMIVTGISGFRNDTAYSLGRHFRDILSAQVMINNDRIFGNTSSLLLVHRLDNRLVA
jgi:acyl-CoA dehydrogenase